MKYFSKPWRTLDISHSFILLSNLISLHFTFDCIQNILLVDRLSCNNQETLYNFQISNTQKILQKLLMNVAGL